MTDFIRRYNPELGTYEEIIKYQDKEYSIEEYAREVFELEEAAEQKKKNK